MPRIGRALASPSLALIKYWGKLSSEKNLPATPSLAVTLAGLESSTEARLAEEDEVYLNDQPQDPARFSAFFDILRSELGSRSRFLIRSSNNFPTAAGLASSSSGFAALAGAVCALLGENPSPRELSALARLGSGSATRSVWGGFTLFPAGALAAEPLVDETFWPEFRVLIVTVREAAKELSSREAMERTRLTSPFFQNWITSSAELLAPAREALERRDLEALGACVRLSYLRMFSTMFSADPPILYWYPESVGLIRACQDLRARGIGAWETMDAGPQVKIFCLADQERPLRDYVQSLYPGLSVMTSRPGPGLRAWTEEIP